MNKLILLCSLLILSPAVINAQNYLTPDGWEWHNGKPYGGKFLGASAVTVDKVYVYGTHGLLLLTTDQGDTYTQIPVPAECIGDITHVSYSKSKQEVAIKFGNNYFYSSDNGKNWIKTTTSPDNTFSTGDAGTGGITIQKSGNEYFIMRGAENLGSPGGILNNTVSFSEANNGFITGYFIDDQRIDNDPNTFSPAIINKNALYYTFNGGDFWAKSLLPFSSEVGVAELIQGPYFIGNNNGFLFARVVTTFSKQIRVYRTSDGGKNWTHATDFTMNNGSGYQLQRFYAEIIDANTAGYLVLEDGFLISATHSSQASPIFNVSDFQRVSGSSKVYVIKPQSDFNPAGFWAADYNPTQAGMTFHERNSLAGNTLYFVDENNGYVGGNQGKVFKTIDGGFNWTDISVAGVNVRNIFFVSIDTGFVVGDKGTMFYTHDGGVKFKPVNTGITEDINRVFFWNGKVGYFETSSGIYATTDGAKTFVKHYAPFKYPTYVTGNQLPLSSSLHVFDHTFTNFYFAQEYYAFNKNSGTANTSKVTNGSGAFVKETGKSMGINVHPNPASHLITVEVGGPQPDVTFEILDQLGRSVISGVIKSNRTLINMNQLRPGIYVLKLNGPDSSHTTKIIKR